MPSFTINYTAQQGQRFATSLGHKLGLRNGSGPIDATAQQCADYLRGCARAVVHEYEAEQNRVQDALDPFDLT